MATKAKSGRRTARKPAVRKKSGNVKSNQSKWVKNEHDERAVAADCIFDEAAAARVVDFFPDCLRHSKGEWGGKPFVLLPWQVDNVVYPVFGWKRKNGYRRIRRCDVWVAKKNGKSTLGAGLGLYLLYGDGERGSEVYSVATKRDQAAIVHREAINMVRAANRFNGRLKINESTHVISHPDSMSRYATLAADSEGAEGINPHALIPDELHAWKDRSFWNTLRYASSARKQPLMFVLSTAGIYDVESIGRQEYEYAKKWLAGEVENQRFHAFIAEAAPEDAENIEDPEVHRKANPSYGITIDPEEMLAEARLARDKPSERNVFLRYCLNIWVEADNPWIEVGKWDACREEFSEDDLVGRECFGGLDLASKRDMTAFVLVFPPNDDDSRWRVLSRFWAPRDNAAEFGNRYGVKYLEWERIGALNLTPGGRISYADVKKQIADDCKRFDVRDIGADPHNLESMRQDIDPDGKLVVEFQQSMGNISPPFKELEALILDGTIAHDGNEVLRWMVSSVTTHEDSEERIRPTKKKSSGKIDGVVALIMALGRAMVYQDETSVYDTDELLVL